MKEDVLEKIAEYGVLPVIKIEDTEIAVQLADALRKGGINALEVTIRNETAFESIRKIHEAFPDMILGAGTILNTSLVDKAKEAGASYIVSPGYNPTTMEYCKKLDMPFVPGCTTASEIEIAISAGLKVLKFFPAEISGGVQALKLYAGPFPDIKFVPTGGINFNNLESYLKNDFIAACGGSFMAESESIANHDWQKITDNCRKAMKISLGFELAHVGMNHETADQAMDNANTLDKIFGLGVKEGNSSIFLAKDVELMKMPFKGHNGHIGFFANSVERAMAWFKRNNIAIDTESIRYDKKGKIVSFYLKEEVNGFALHVVRR